MSTLLSLIFSKVGLYAAAAVALLAAGCWLHWRWEHGSGPKLATQVLRVAGAANGATLNVRGGFAGRSTAPAFVAGIAAPGLNDPLGPQSRDNLAALAGDTVRLVAPKQGLGSRGVLVGQIFGDTGADLAVAQLRAGLAKCETGATKEQIAAESEARKARRGLWQTTGGSSWFHFGPAAADFPEAIPLEPPGKNMLDYGLILEVAVLAIVAVWIFWYFCGAAISKQFSGAAGVTSAVTSAVDVTEEVTAYTALTGVRYMPNVAADPQAITACEYLLTAVMKWPASKPAAATPAAAVAKS